MRWLIFTYNYKLINMAQICKSSKNPMKKVSQFLIKIKLKVMEEFH